MGEDKRGVYLPGINRRDYSFYVPGQQIYKPDNFVSRWTVEAFVESADKVEGLTALVEGIGPIQKFTVGLPNSTSVARLNLLLKDDTYKASVYLEAREYKREVLVRRGIDPAVHEIVLHLLHPSHFKRKRSIECIQQLVAVHKKFLKRRA